jgi:competence protein ComEA
VDWIKENKMYVLAGIIAMLFFLYTTFDDEAEMTEVGEGAMAIVTDDKVDMDEKAVETRDQKELLVMMADIKGAVINPGVYEVQEGGRVIDLIELAGGLAQDADPAAINFALYVEDEMAIYVPRIGEEVNGALPVQAGQGGGEGTGGTVNLNTAQSNELQTLPGIGPAKAEAIIEYRETNGPFKSTEGLKEISGIGDKTFEKLKDLISVK